MFRNDLMLQNSKKEFQYVIKLRCTQEDFNTFLKNYGIPEPIKKTPLQVEKPKFKQETKYLKESLTQEQRVKELNDFFDRYNKRKKRTEEDQRGHTKRTYVKHTPQISCCPSIDCTYHNNPQGKWYICKGTFTQKWSQEKIRRFQCKKCKISFSSDPTKENFKQHKPFLEKQIENSNLSQRNLANTLNTTRTTIARKLKKIKPSSP
jgi:hypothetical protein